MAAYAINKGYDDHPVILEDHSNTTWENIANSVKLIQGLVYGDHRIRCYACNQSVEVLQYIRTPKGSCIPEIPIASWIILVEDSMQSGGMSQMD